jgi:hypothetical protein
VKLIIVPYMSNPPMILMIMAEKLMSAQCANMAGRARSKGGQPDSESLCVSFLGVQAQEAKLGE